MRQFYLEDVEMFGRTIQQGGEVFTVDLVDDQAAVPANEMNLPFKTWVHMPKA